MKVTVLRSTVYEVLLISCPDLGYPDLTARRWEIWVRVFGAVILHSGMVLFMFAFSRGR